ncbi:2-C-methyl-D-erythritol 2,4-cyclodiphosphate synthase, partial [Candidatus Peregrinibacteria bacterium]|nr:2-C-methyl-D-erythritol 2,4-cyclodiphosphate synthase [Candidatus Peregrinibacteria bacterium]
SLANLLQIQESQIGITATTGEKLTPFGRGEGIQCLATVTLKTVCKNL